MKPLCFVLMPFGKKPNGDGRIIDFDKVYELLIKPAIQDADLEPLRADEEKTGGIIHKPMFERLILCQYAVADLTTANANVFYELGVRHAIRPWATQLLFAQGFGQLPFDINMLRALPYQLTPDGIPDNIGTVKTTLTERLKDAQGNTDSPIFQVLENYPDIQNMKTDVFRNQVKYAETMKRTISEACKKGVNSLKEIEKSLEILHTDTSIVIDLFLSYRSIEAFKEMIELYHKMPPHLASTVMVREQLGLALNRAGKSEEAESVLKKLIEERGASSETLGILGRVYKDRYLNTKKKKQSFMASGLLQKAIDTYVRGFESDSRDAYPGINAVTLMELLPQIDPRQKKLLSVIRFAVENKIEKGTPDYWDYATLLELSVLEKDTQSAYEALCKALPLVKDKWMTLTTINNLNMIRQAREERGEYIDSIEVIDEIINQLQSTVTI